MDIPQFPTSTQLENVLHRTLSKNVPPVHNWKMFYPEHFQKMSHQYTIGKCFTQNTFKKFPTRTQVENSFPRILWDEFPQGQN